MSSKYANKQFWVDAGDRAVSTFAQASIGAIGTTATGLTDLDFEQIASIGGLAALISVLTSIAFRGRDDKPVE